MSQVKPTWYRGKMVGSQAVDPGSIPGRCNLFQKFEKFSLPCFCASGWVIEYKGVKAVRCQLQILLAFQTFFCKTKFDE